MSTQSFVNALIGLARDYHRLERRKKEYSGGRQYWMRPLAPDVVQQMREAGYFDLDTVRKFGGILQLVLEKSKPSRKKKTKEIK